MCKCQVRRKRATYRFAQVFAPAVRHGVRPALHGRRATRAPFYKALRAAHTSCELRVKRGWRSGRHGFRVSTLHCERHGPKAAVGRKF